LLLCHGTVCVVGKMRDLILQLSKSSIYSTKPCTFLVQHNIVKAFSRVAMRLAGTSGTCVAD
ncbi:hypothetical protein ACOTWU_19135, partial [Enterobacter cloacae complex sp. GYL001]